jgi:hypothetical protein
MFKKKRLCLALILLFVISTPLFTSSNLSEIWGNYEDYYEYSYLKEFKIYDDSRKVIDVVTYRTEYKFWNLTIEDNWLHYRCSEYMKILAFLKCTTETCYNNTLFDRFNYDRETETVGIGIAFDSEESRLYTTDANGRAYGNVYDISVPLDIMQVFFNNYFWYGLFALFLPVESSVFSFITNYSDYSEFPYSSFEFEYSTSFKYRGEKFKGHYFRITFEEGVLFDYSVVFENHEMEYKYSDNGLLYSFHDTSELYSNLSGEVKLEKTQVWQTFLESEGEKVFETNSEFIINIILLVLMECFRRKKKKYTFV